jgi:hypothetical protein
MEKVVIDLQVNSDKGIKDVNKLNESLNKTNENQKKLKKSTNDVSKATKKSTNTSQRNAAGFEAVNKATGGAVRGFRSLIKQMWLLVANPVGAVIAAVVLGLTALYKAFTSTKAGGEQLKQVMAGISAVIDVVRDRVLKVGEALIKFFTGDFKGALKAGKESVSGFGAEVAKEFKQAADSVKSLQEVTDAFRLLGVSRAKLNRDLIQAKEIIEGSTATYLEKKKAIDEVRIAETKQTDEELANAKKKLDAIILANSLSDSGGEDLDAEAAARIAVINLEAISSSNKTKFNKLAKLAHSTEIARLKTIADAKKKAIDEDNASEKKKAEDKKKIDAKLIADKKIIDELEANTEEEKMALALEKEKEKFDNAIALAIEQGLSTEELERSQKESLQLMRDGFAQTDIDRAAKIAATKKAIDNNAARDAKIIADKTLRDAKIIADAKLKTMNMSANAVIGIVGRESKMGKAVAVSQAIWNTKAAITKTLASVPAPFNIPQAIATGVFGLLQVKDILKTPNPVGGGSGGGSVPSVGSAPTLPSIPPSFNIVGQSSTNQLASAIGGQSQKPSRAYVVAGDVSTAQDMDRNIIEGSSL